MEWLDMLASSCGVGLWDAIFHEGDSLHPEAIWIWSAEFRRLLGFETEADFPNVAQSWSDRLHPDDAERSFAIFGAAAASGSRFDMTYRLKMKNGTYRWFHATGSILLDKNGRGRRACGSLVDIHEARLLQHEQQRSVEQIVEITKRLAAGDLTASLGDDFPESMTTLKTSLNTALYNLREMIGSVSDSAIVINTGSNQIAQASEDFARRTESNAASLEETAAALAQMDGRLKASAVAAGRTVECADQAGTTVGAGRAVADEAVQAMERVSGSAKGIDNVIEGMDKIAFQTRVLAMNAAVEAGRAGDAGRGFAVVADLVSALAMRAEEEAKRARDQLTVTQAEIITAVHAVTEVDGALAAISGDVAQVHELLSTMAADNQAQSAAITQISSAIGTMDQSTQQNAAMVEETSAAARNLASEVGSLAEQTGRFKVGNDGRSAPARRPDYATPAAYTAPIRPLPAAIRAVARADDNWTSF
ncbi:PAS domain-containing methyl-accepting chemotaxis protein [uncultured Sphingomonas sp.]|uniref:methyl-accepting chemotaxis protein n=1 Tax=uncultured Sphingomonas sp. TaxID=158754 RepID=UPI0030DB176C